MTTLKTQSKEMLAFLNGCEIWSENYAACVGVYKGRVYNEGEVVDTLDTDAKIESLFAEYAAGEL
jgi:hypothetical protein